MLTLSKVKVYPYHFQQPEISEAVQDIEQFGMWHLVPGCQSVDGQQTLAPADLGEGPGGPPPLYLDQTEARSAEKMFFFFRPPPLSQGEGLNDTSPLI